MANKLKRFLPNIISKEQGGFFEGHQIVDGIIELHKVIHSVDIGNKDTFLLKLDMMKAYDNQLDLFE